MSAAGSCGSSTCTPGTALHGSASGRSPIRTPPSGSWSARPRLRRSGTTRATRRLVCPGRSPCLRSSTPPTPTWSTSSSTSICSVWTCVLARLWSVRSTSWLRRLANTSPPVSFTLGSCHRLSAQVQQTRPRV